MRMLTPARQREGTTLQFYAPFTDVTKYPVTPTSVSYTAFLESEAGGLVEIQPVTTANVINGRAHIRIPAAVVRCEVPRKYSDIRIEVSATLPDMAGLPDETVLVMMKRYRVTPAESVNPEPVV